MGHRKRTAINQGGPIHTQLNVGAMSKPKVHRWRISRIRGTPAEFVGYVEAPSL
jgi:hypothetical protein